MLCKNNSTTKLDCTVHLSKSFPDFDDELERINATFAAIKNKYPPGWRRKIVLGWLADYHGIPKAEFRSSFELWQIEEVDR